MGWLDKIFGKNEQTPAPTASEGADHKAHVSSEASAIAAPFAGLDGIRFGRYSDNNKSYKKTQSWYIAEDRFKEKNYPEAFAALFDYLRDDVEDNVRFRPDGGNFTFDIVQGSKMVKGACDGEKMIARVPLAVMETPATAVMRRLLDMNFSLYYSRNALDDQNTLCMIFDTEVVSASPNKLYYGLRELATKADRQDDLLLADFSTLKPIGTEHIQQLSEQELDIKYNWFRKWIEDTLTTISELNQDSFSGSIAYLMLTLVYRVDFLITPEAKLLSQMEQIHSLYWDKKEEVTLVERNQLMKEAARKLLDITREDFAASVYRSKSTFAISAPGPGDKIREHVVNGNSDSRWYIDNKYPALALVLNEYGVMYNQFIYSMPRVLTDLTTIYMAVMHAGFFIDMGMQQPLFNPTTGEFNKDAIRRAINEALERYADKFPEMKWDHNRLSFSSLYDFGVSFTEQMANLNLETKR